MDSIISNKNYQVQLFLDSGKGFIEEESIKELYKNGQLIYKFDITKYIKQNIFLLRLDPLDESCVISIDYSYLIDESGMESELKFQYSNADIFNKMMYFANKDPQIYYSISNTSKKSGFVCAFFKINYHYCNI